MTTKASPAIKDAGDAGQPEPALSEYEQARARNIEKNNARLRSLGLITAAEERRSNDIAWCRHSSRNDGESSDGDRDEDSSSDEEYTEGAKAPKRKKRSKSRAPPREGSRKSRRLMNLPSELGGEFAPPNETPSERKERKERLRKERQAMVEECREARQRAAVEVAKAGVEMAGKENPTATYEHCLMRVRSMSEKGLANRVRAIERAAGKHCVVKMAIFKSCLQDQNMWELARLASEALERLKAGEDLKPLFEDNFGVLVLENLTSLST